MKSPLKPSTESITLPRFVSAATESILNINAASFLVNRNTLTPDAVTDNNCRTRIVEFLWELTGADAANFQRDSPLKLVFYDKKSFNACNDVIFI